MAKDRHVDDASKAMNRGGRPAALTPQHILLLREIVSRMPHATLDELAGELDHTGQVRVCTATIRRTLRAQGIVRSMPTRETRRSIEPEAKAALSKRYGYTAAHRREAGPHYSTDLTDAEWALVADLFERPHGGRGAPARYERRLWSMPAAMCCVPAAPAVAIAHEPQYRADCSSH